MEGLICPVCGGALVRDGGRYTDDRRHSFDISARGYVHLMPGAGAGDHGDNREMILARRAFLEEGWYAPLLDEVTDVLHEYCPDIGFLIDAGCGEGWYTDGILRAFPEARGIGIDISRDAFRFAAKREAVSSRLTLAVASVYRLPVADECADLVTCLFSPLVTAEYARVLRQGGHMLYVIPDTDHLWGLKELLYDTPYPNAVKDPALTGFTLVDTRLVRRVVTLPSESAEHLFLMTPYAYRTGSAGRERLKSAGEITTPISFRVFLYKKGEKSAALS